MDSEAVVEFRGILSSLILEKESEIEFKNFQIVRCTHLDQHPLQNVDQSLCTLPFLLAYGHSHHSTQIPESPRSYTSNTSRHGSQGSCNDTSLAGSPLKLEEFHVPRTQTIQITADSEAVKPVCLDDARLLLSLYNLATDPYVEESLGGDTVLPLWVLCHGDGVEPITVMSGHTTSSPDGALLRCYQAVSKGPFTGLANIPKLTVNGQVVSAAEARKQLQTQCAARYEVLSGTRQTEDEANETRVDPQQSSQLTLNLEWHKMAALLQTPPQSAKTTVEAQVAAGDMRSSAHAMYSELMNLKNITEGLSGEGVVKWNMADDNVCVRPVDMLKQLIEDRNTETVAEDEQMFPLMKTARNDLDFTEELWTILKDCGSYKELVQCLDYVLSCLGRSLVQPMVHKSNKSQLAQLVRDSYYHQMAPPVLQARLPIQMLAEIGVEKIKRDYIHVLIGKDLATFDQMSHFVSSLEQLPIHERFMRLYKLHHVVELVAILEQFLSLPQVALSVSARSALRHYEHSEVDTSHVFVVPIPTNSISSYIDRFKPYWWKVKVSSRCYGNSVDTVAVLSTTPSIKHVNPVLLKVKNTDSDKLNTTDGSDGSLAYYYTHVTEFIHDL